MSGESGRMSVRHQALCTRRPRGCDSRRQQSSPRDGERNGCPDGVCAGRGNVPAAGAYDGEDGCQSARAIWTAVPDAVTMSMEPSVPSTS